MREQVNCSCRQVCKALLGLHHGSDDARAAINHNYNTQEQKTLFNAVGLHFFSSNINDFRRLKAILKLPSVPSQEQSYRPVVLCIKS